MKQCAKKKEYWYGTSYKHTKQITSEKIMDLYLTGKAIWVLEEYTRGNFFDLGLGTE